MLRHFCLTDRMESLASILLSNMCQLLQSLTRVWSTKIFDCEYAIAVQGPTLLLRHSFQAKFLQVSILFLYFLLPFFLTEHYWVAAHAKKRKCERKNKYIIDFSKYFKSRVKFMLQHHVISILKIDQMYSNLIKLAVMDLLKSCFHRKI